MPSGQRPLSREEKSMGSRRSRGPFIQATLCEIERGLFQLSYRTGNAALRVDELPIYQVAASADDAKRRVEVRAMQCGFDLVVWDYGLLPVPRRAVLDPACRSAHEGNGAPSVIGVSAGE
jgi:hypothetical protein